MTLFIQFLWTEPLYYVSWVFTVIVSIILHELAHGWAALRHGDNTPRVMGRMTADPMVHMGGFSLCLLAMFGIAWGQMPIDPTRMRGKYAEAAVAVAGPAMNLALAFVGLTILGVLQRFEPAADLPPELVDENVLFWSNLGSFLFVFGQANIVLCLLNLFPVPPLDGSRILANFNHDYARFISDPDKQGPLMLGFLLVFMVVPQLFQLANTWTTGYLDLLTSF